MIKKYTDQKLELNRSAVITDELDNLLALFTHSAINNRHMSFESIANKKMVVPIKLSGAPVKKTNSADNSLMSFGTQPWVKREFALFMKSATILNQGLSQIK